MVKMKTWDRLLQGSATETLKFKNPDPLTTGICLFPSLILYIPIDLSGTLSYH